MYGSGVERTPGESWSVNCVERGCVVHISPDSHDTVVTRTARKQGFKALGGWIIFDGHFVKELAEREVTAWKSFYAIRNFFV